VSDGASGHHGEVGAGVNRAGYGRFVKPSREKSSGKELMQVFQMREQFYEVMETFAHPYVFPVHVRNNRRFPVLDDRCVNPESHLTPVVREGDEGSRQTFQESSVFVRVTDDTALSET